MYGNPTYLQQRPSYGKTADYAPLMGHDATQSDLAAIAYQIEKAKTTGPISGQKAFVEAQGAYWEGMKLTQNIFLRGPEDDKMAYLTVAWCAAMAARTLGKDKNAGVVAIAEKYFTKGKWAKPFNLFLDYRKDILIDGLRELQGALTVAGKIPQQVYGVAILVDAAKETNLDWSAEQLNYLNLMGEFVQDVIGDVGGAVDPDKWEEFWKKNKWWIIPSGGLLLTSIVLIAGRPYLVAGREAVSGLLGDKDEKE